MTQAAYGGFIAFVLIAAHYASIAANALPFGR